MAPGLYFLYLSIYSLHGVKRVGSAIAMTGYKLDDRVADVRVSEQAAEISLHQRDKLGSGVQ
jgi:hypothetical protein